MLKSCVIAMCLMIGGAFWIPAEADAYTSFGCKAGLHYHWTTNICHTPSAGHTMGGTWFVNYNNYSIVRTQDAGEPPKAVIFCGRDVAGGVNLKEKEQAFVCALNLKEIGTKCMNPQNNSKLANGRPYDLIGKVVKVQSGGAFTKQKNGMALAQVIFTDEDIQLIVDEWNSEHPGEGFIDLGSPTEAGCPSDNWIVKWAPTRFDLVATTVVRPKSPNPLYPSVTRYSCSDHTYPLSPPVTECVPNKEPFLSCEREISGLEFIVYSDTGQPTTVSDRSLTKMSDCLLHRDVNRDPNFRLPLQNTSSGVYNPDVDHLSDFGAPFTGLADPAGDQGGEWLPVSSGGFIEGTYYIGTCHQHGQEIGQGDFKQSGPAKLVLDSSGNVLSGDPKCTGGAQVQDIP